MRSDSDAARATPSTLLEEEREVLELWTWQELEWVDPADGPATVELLIHERRTGRAWRLFRARLTVRPTLRAKSLTSPQDVDMPVGP